MEALEMYEHAGCTVVIYYDPEPTSPAEWDNLGTCYALRRDAEYRGFEPHSETHGRAIEANERGGARLLVRYLRMCHGVYAIPFDVYEHGTTSLSACRDLDSDDAEADAYIATTHEQVSRLCGEDARYHAREWIEDALRGELDTWRAYFEGDVYGYVVYAGQYQEPEDGIDVYGARERYVESLESVGSCWGFYPDDPANLIEPSEQSTPEYRAAWDALGGMYDRRLANMLAEAFGEAAYEAEQRERAEREGIPTS